MEPWSADDPWQERRDPSPGWDEWPPPAPTADDFAVDAPASTASDPWAESWADEVPGIPTSPPPEREPYVEPSPDVGYESSQPPAFDSTEAPPAPAFEPPIDEPEAEPFTDAEPQPFTEAERPVAPRIEPWSPDSDPWGAAWTVSPVVDETKVEEHVAEEHADEAPSVEEAGAEDELDAGVLPAESPSDAWQAAELEPDLEPEPPLTADDSHDEEPDLAAAAIAGMAFEGAADATPPTEEDSTDNEPSFADAALVATAGAAIVGSVGDEPASESQTARPWESASESEPEPVAEAEPEAEPQPEPRAEPEPEPAYPPPIWDAGTAPVAEESPTAESLDDATVGELGAPDDTVAIERDEADQAWDAVAAAAAATETPDAEPERDQDEAGHLPEAAIAAAAIAASQPEIEARRPDVPWLDRPDQTEVYPTTWEPPPPPPPAIREVSEVAPQTGAVRTTLGQAEPEVDDELAEEATTAEQAVPWLIGVILLLAGMVIVLLALIFAGDASLGGGASASPTASAVAFVPSASGAESPTPRPSPSDSPEPSKSPDAIPQYGDLEMIYQGRSAALEPIYLLRRDFGVEGDPEVLAQDPDLDVRRFAWAPDGTRGAFLYADRALAIDPGVDIHFVSDGISAITFGDVTKTVYAVRVTADGANDVASVLAVDHATGKERELDRVSYPRPTIEAEAAVDEAQFVDDGGAVRLFWMHDDRLRLWILDGGTWTIDPAEGDATKLDEEALPVLWAPEGERRVRTVADGDKTRMRVVDRSGDAIATTTVTGRVSHLRWSPRGDQVVFTLGRPTSGGGVLQDLYLWNLDDSPPMMITNTGAGFGAEWRGSQARWEED